MLWSPFLFFCRWYDLVASWVVFACKTIHLGGFVVAIVVAVAVLGPLSPLYD